MLISIALAYLDIISSTGDVEIVRLITSFKVEGALVIKKRWSLLNAVWGNQGIYLMQAGKEMHPVKGFRDLRGLVKIENAESALNYVRLATSPTCAYSFGEGEFEVISRGSLDMTFVFGEERICKYILTERDGAYGIVPKSYLSQFGLDEAKVESFGNKFLVTRWLVTGRVPSSACTKVSETVSPDGSYERRNLKRKHLNQIFVPSGGA
jgi:hypothetical protein